MLCSRAQCSALFRHCSGVFFFFIIIINFFFFTGSGSQGTRRPLYQGNAAAGSGDEAERGMLQTKGRAGLGRLLVAPPNGARGAPGSPRVPETPQPARNPPGVPKSPQRLSLEASLHPPAPSRRAIAPTRSHLGHLGGRVWVSTPIAPFPSTSQTLPPS